MASRSHRPAAPAATVARAGRALVHTMTSLDQVRALAHPLRLRLLELFAAEPRTTKQVAGILGGNPTRLYHHVNALERLGLLRLVETRRNRGTVEKYFQAAARRFEVDRGLFAGREGAPALQGLATAVFDQARAELVEAAHAELAGPDDTPVALRAAVSATPAQFARLRRELLAFIRRSVKRIRAGRPADRAGTRLYALTVGLMPALSKPRAARATASGAKRRTRRRR